ncbi:MAG: prephenate dehydratase, partial [Planctomycetaceae bacterium]
MGNKDPKRVTSKKAPVPKPVRQSEAAAPRVNLASLAAEIGKVDKEIIRLANRRAALTVRQIQGQPLPAKALFASSPDAQLTALLDKSVTGPLQLPALRAIFRELVSGARQAVKPVRVVYLGPEYSFTHLAAIERFGSSASLIPVSNIAAVFEEVNRGYADYGIAPIENSTDGRIVDTLDMFTRLPLKICGEVQLPIHHNLLARCPRNEVSEIYSKPQALSQCREWLSRNMPQSRLVEVTSTSTAAQLARDRAG